MTALMVPHEEVINIVSFFSSRFSLVSYSVDNKTTIFARFTANKFTISFPLTKWDVAFQVF